MARAPLALLFGLGLSTAACSEDVEIISAAASGGPSSSASSSSGEGSGGATGASGAATGGGGAGGEGAGGQGGGASGEPLPEGHYLQTFLGNCINAEEWLSFGPNNGFVHTFVDRDFCGPHAVSAVEGKRSMLDGGVEIAWEPANSAEYRLFTHALLDPYPHPDEPQWPPHEGYVLGKAALNTMAYARADDGLTFHRRDRRVTVPPNGDTYDVTVDIGIAFDAPLIVPQGPTACVMTVDISVTTVWGQQTELGAETFTLPCTYQPDADRPWVRVTADGFEQSSIDNTWAEYLGDMGVWQKYPSLVTNPLYDAFRPVLFYAPSSGARLFHDRQSAWYLAMEHPPPTTVE